MQGSLIVVVSVLRSGVKRIRRPSNRGVIAEFGLERGTPAVAKVGVRLFEKKDACEHREKGQESYGDTWCSIGVSLKDRSAKHGRPGLSGVGGEGTNHWS